MPSKNSKNQHIEPSQSLVVLGRNEDQARQEIDLTVSYLDSQLSPRTMTVYMSDFKMYCEWCQSRGIAPLPSTAKQLAVFLSCQASEGRRPNTLARRLAAIDYFHRINNLVSPTGEPIVRAALSGIRRVHGTAVTKKKPATAEIVRKLPAVFPNSIVGIRDRAIMLLLFAGAFRRSELAGIMLKDIHLTREGLLVILRSSKGDQEGRGQDVAVLKGEHVCPVEAVTDWIKSSGITGGYLFRRIVKGGGIPEYFRMWQSDTRKYEHVPNSLTGHSVNHITKKYLGLLGINPKDVSSHSFRAGFLTSAAEQGASIFKMAEISRHKSLDTLKEYVRKVDAFKNHAGKDLL